MFECHSISEEDPQASPLRVLAVGPHHERDGVSAGELGQISEMAGSIWPGVDIAPGLWAQIDQDAGDDSDDNGFMRPLKQWSPLGLRDDRIGGLRDGVDLISRLAGQDELPGAHEHFGSMRVDRDASPHHFPRFGMSDGQGAALGAAVFMRRSFVAAFPARTTSLRVGFSAVGSAESAELGAAQAALLAPPLVHLDEEMELKLLIWWRIYIGSNTFRSDGVSRTRQWFSPIISRSTRSAGVIVGTAAVILQRLKRPSNDPTCKFRLTAAETKFNSYLSSCPKLTAESRMRGHAFIAVHGTMACGMPLASAIHDLLAGPPVFRFEHDTWLPLRDNVLQLRALIGSLNASSVTLIAHSRGGLVAAECARTLPHVGVITLGTPYYGTPLISAADVSMLGLRSLMGLVRVSSGVVLVDAATYLAGFFIRGVPPGLATMREGSDLSERRRDEVPRVLAAVAGSAPPGDLADTAGSHFLSGITRSHLMPDPHDLIVTRESAAGGAAHVINVDCDHFSYLDEMAVRQFIIEVASAASTASSASPEPDIDW